MALFITSDLAWVLSWRRHKEDRGEAWEGGGGSKSNQKNTG